MVLYLDRVWHRWLHALPWSHNGILMRRQVQNLAVPHDFCFILSVLWNDLADPVFDGVGLVGFMSKANAFLLA